MNFPDKNISYASFAKEELHRLQVELDEELTEYLSGRLNETSAFPTVVHESVNSYMDIVIRGGKRLRGAFVLQGHELFGGSLSRSELLKAAMAIEMIHAYLLVIDDFTDISDLRRGSPTAHKMMQKFHKENTLKGDDWHFGGMTAITASLVGQHMASNLILEIDATTDVLKKALIAVNSTIINTAYGQIHDIYNSVGYNITESDVINVHTYKTAFYTYQNPIQLGAILAGATDEELKLLEDYAIPAGIAFQLQDDILGMFGDSEVTGKGASDDLAEGKMTLLIQKALENSDNSQKEILMAGLGNRTVTEAQHEAVKKVIIDTGAYEYNKSVSIDLVKKAKEAMYKNFSHKADLKAFQYIVGIADYMIERDL